VREDRAVAAEPSRQSFPIVFGPEAAQIFGLYHPPNPTVACGTGVVLCNPFGHEAMCTHRTYRHLAERLASAGFHAFRFDYHGTGDSSGDAGDPARLRTWLDGIGAAIDELRVVAGVRAVNLFGVRLGATLATLAAAERRDVQGLVLWAPFVKGGAYVRELRAFRKIAEQAGQHASSALCEGDEEVAGHVFKRATAAELSAIDLLAHRERFVDRAIVLSRDDLPGGEARLAQHLDACGVETVLRVEPGYARMMRDPQDTIVPYAMLDTILAWVGERREPAPTPPVVFDHSCVLTASSHATGCPVREEPVSFGDGGRLFGILTERCVQPDVCGRPAIVFLNVGANHRVGPNRMYVTLARDLAALGCLCLRFDIAGLGDSRVADGIDENMVYSTTSLGDVEAAITFLTRIRGAARVVLLGICSGAYLAFRAGLMDPRIVGEVLINPQTFERKEGDSIDLWRRPNYKSTRYYLGAMLDRGVWRQALRRGLDLRGVGRVLRERLAARAIASLDEAMASWRGRPPPRTDVEQAFRAMSDRGIKSLLVFSSNDGGLDMIEKHLGRDACKLQGGRNVELAIIAGADHTFTAIQSRRVLYSLITRFVERAYPSSIRSSD
jgi:alpha-beta hydrolase superfamily lysophospholipase